MSVLGRGPITNVLTDITNSTRPQNKKKFSVLCNNELAQQFLANAYHYFKNILPYVGSPADVTAECLKVDRKTVLKYKNGPTFETFKEVTRQRKKCSTSDLSINLQTEVRNVIYDLYRRKQSITLNSLNTELKEKMIYDHGRISLFKLLKGTLGFSYRKDDDRRAMMEKPHVKDLRSQFLEKYMLNAYTCQKSCIFLNETWIYANGSIRRSWQDEDVRSVKRIGGDGGT